MVPGACATGGGSPPRASLRRGIPTSAPAARAGSLFRFSRGGRTWHCAPGQGGTAAAKSGPRGGCSGAGPGARRRGRGGARGAEQGERPEARARRRRGRDGAERGGRRAASPGKCGERGRGAPGGRGSGRGSGRRARAPTCLPPPEQSPAPGAPSLCPEVGNGWAGCGELEPPGFGKAAGSPLACGNLPQVLLFWPPHSGPSAFSGCDPWVSWARCAEHLSRRPGLCLQSSPSDGQHGGRSGSSRAFLQVRAVLHDPVRGGEPEKPEKRLSP